MTAGTTRQPPLVDTHAHVMDAAFAHDLEAVLERAQQAGVGRLICVGYDLKGSRAALDLAYRYPHLIRATVGIHPNSVATTPRAAFDAIEQLAEDPAVVAIGETGLDYYRDRTPPELQRESLLWHLRLAEARRLPVIIHNRDADDDTAQLLEDSARRRAGGEARGILHCFSSLNRGYLERMLAAGYYVSLAGTITYRSAAGLRDMVKHVPMDRLLVETDCPYLAPVPRRGTRNEPAFVRHTAEQVATIKGVPLAVLAEQMWTGCVRLFPSLAHNESPRHSDSRPSATLEVTA